MTDASMPKKSAITPVNNAPTAWPASIQIPENTHAARSKGQSKRKRRISPGFVPNPALNAAGTVSGCSGDVAALTTEEAMIPWKNGLRLLTSLAFKPAGRRDAWAMGMLSRQYPPTFDRITNVRILPSSHSISITKPPRATSPVTFPLGQADGNAGRMVMASSCD